MANINVRVTNSQRNSRDLVEVADTATIGDLLRNLSIPYTDKSYAISYNSKQPGSTIMAVLPSAIDSIVLSDMSDVYVTYTQQKGN